MALVYNKKNLSPYGQTPVNRAGYLDILRPRAIPVHPDDVLYEIKPEFTYRPDLLAYTAYGQKELWWVFAQRNMNIIKDPIFDFVAGTKIYLPQDKLLRQILGV